MYKIAMKCNKTLSKWCKNKHGASKIIDTFETYQGTSMSVSERFLPTTPDMEEMLLDDESSTQWSLTESWVTEYPLKGKH
jgi:hypothetical protein